MENTKKTLTINGHEVEIGSEKNLLEMIRKIGIELPTFCYHSELSAYGACRLCLVEVEGRGIMASCSTAPEAGMKIRTDSKQLREMRKINIELLLANHKRECPSCIRSYSCTLQNLARRLGVEEIRYKQITEFEPIDESSPSLTRDPNKCVLCGDCVRMCKEVQGIGAIDFTHRGSHSKVAPAFEADLASVECINCGQCVQVCPTGALTKDGLTPSLCLSHITQKKGALSEQEALALRAGGLAWGCDRCLLACPHNYEPKKTPIEAFLSDTEPVLTAENLSRLMHNRAFAWRGRAVLERNLALLQKPDE